MTTVRPLHGIVPIPVTPFSESGELDLAGMASQVEFCVQGGADGLLYPGVVSEFYTLSDDERELAVRTFVEAVAGRIPVAIGVSTTSTAAAVRLATQASALGVDAIMTMTPFVQHFFAPSLDFTTRHLRAVADAADLPVILQNARIGHPVPIVQLAGIASSVPQVRYIKQETHPSTQAITDVLTALGNTIDGVFGGVGGIYLVNELDRGAIGSMPAPPFVDRIATAYSAYSAEGAPAAQRILDPLGTLFTRELLYNAVFIKEVLRRRGVLSTAAVRIASPTMDGPDLADLDRMLASAGID